MGFMKVDTSEIARFPHLEQIFNDKLRDRAIAAPPGLALAMLSLFNAGKVWREAARSSRL
jgi:hypothetical protein